MGPVQEHETDGTATRGGVSNWSRDPPELASRTKSPKAKVAGIGPGLRDPMGADSNWRVAGPGVDGAEAPLVWGVSTWLLRPATASRQSESVGLGGCTATPEPPGSGGLCGGWRQTRTADLGIMRTWMEIYETQQGRGSACAMAPPKFQILFRTPQIRVTKRSNTTAYGSEAAYRSRASSVRRGSTSWVKVGSFILAARLASSTARLTGVCPNSM